MDERLGSDGIREISRGCYDSEGLHAEEETSIQAVDGFTGVEQVGKGAVPVEWDLEDDDGVFEEIEMELGEEADEEGDLDEGYVTPTNSVVGSVVGGSVNVPVIPTPAVGMVFPSMLDVEQYFLDYANQLGFGIVRASGATGKGGKKRRNTVWTCDAYGKPRSRTKKGKGVKLATDSIMYEEVGGVKRKSKKCGCPVSLYAGVTDFGQWEIRKAVMEHEGHKFTPRKARKIARNRRQALKVNGHLVRRLFNDRKSRVPVNKIYRCMARERNGVGEMPFSSKDLHHEVEKQRRLILGKGDAMAMFEYFAKMTSNNQNFFHMHRVDEEGRLQDVLWVDARSRVAYEEFGDVVCFDSTYMTNEYELPFSNFVGVNHHGQSILLGCALLSRETTETFEWLFRTWLLCMGGRKPIGILTDQDPAMRRALRNTMQDTCHRWCIWHILSKFGKKLGKYEKYQDFKVELENVVYDSLKPEEFDVGWTAVIAKYNLDDDEWLIGLFEERDMWVPTYLKHLFWAGMKTTQRVESMNSFFDGYLDKHTRLYEFVERYIEAMEARADNEKDADDNCARYVRRTLSDFPQEKIFQQVYTDAKFREVQREFERVLYLNCDKKQVSDHLWEHVVEERVWVKLKSSGKETRIRKKRGYLVRYNSLTKDVSCDCMHFECHGIMCRHMLKVYDLHDHYDVPEKYILRRWRKDVPRRHTRVKVAYHDPSKTEVVRRYDRLMVIADPINSKASLYKDTTELVMQALQLLDIQVEERLSIIEKKKSEANRESKMGTPTGGKDMHAAKDRTPPSVTQKRKLLMAASETDMNDSENLDQLQSGVQSGVGSTVNVLDPKIPPKKSHRTSDLRLKSCAEVSAKEQAAKKKRADAERRRAEAELKKAERERAKEEKQKAAEQRRLEMEQKRKEKQKEAEEKRLMKEKAIKEKKEAKEARERMLHEKKLQKERAQNEKQQRMLSTKLYTDSQVTPQQIMINQCHQQIMYSPLTVENVGSGGVPQTSVSTGGICFRDVNGVISYFTTLPTPAQSSGPTSATAMALAAINPSREAEIHNQGMDAAQVTSQS